MKLVIILKMEGKMRGEIADEREKMNEKKGWQEKGPKYDHIMQNVPIPSARPRTSRAPRIYEEVAVIFDRLEPVH